MLKIRDEVYGVQQGTQRNSWTALGKPFGMCGSWFVVCRCICGTIASVTCYRIWKETSTQCARCASSERAKYRPLGEVPESIDGEQIVQVPSCPRLFVTRTGKVYRPNHSGVLVPATVSTTKHGHSFVSYKAIPQLVHRLVLEAFRGPCPEGMEGCHDNDIPNDNRLENLRWDTHQENIQDAVRNGNLSPTSNLARPRKAKSKCIA